jgi:hypothetical protein
MGYALLHPSYRLLRKIPSSPHQTIVGRVEERNPTNAPILIIIRRHSQPPPQSQPQTLALNGKPFHDQGVNLISHSLDV